MVAVLKAGAAFVPLDPSHPVERLRSLCDSVGADMVLCARQLVPTLTQVGLETVLPVDDQTLVECPELPSDQPGHSVMTNVSSSNVAYVIFTSGSTGKPKVSNIISPLPSCCLMFAASQIPGN